MKFSELSESQKTSAIKREFIEVFCFILNRRERADKLLSGDDHKKMMDFLDSLDKKFGCHCDECVDYMKYTKFPLDEALEPLIDIAREKAQSKEDY